MSPLQYDGVASMICFTNDLISFDETNISEKDSLLFINSIVCRINCVIELSYIYSLLE